jgi:hypothetical protein
MIGKKTSFEWLLFFLQFIFMETSERPTLNQALESLQKDLKVAPTLS